MYNLLLGMISFEIKLFKKFSGKHFKKIAKSLVPWFPLEIKRKVMSSSFIF